MPETVHTGSAANAGDGDMLRNAFQQINQKFVAVQAGQSPDAQDIVQRVETARDDAEVQADLATEMRDAAALSATVAQAARDAATINADLYASTAAAIDLGVSAATISTAGTGGTNGTHALAFSGGGGSGAAGTFTVSSGAVTAVAITARGTGYTSAPTVSLAASSGLTGAAVVTTIAPRVAVGSQFQVVAVDGLSIQRYVVGAGPVATSVGAPFPTSAAVTAEASTRAADDATLSAAVVAEAGTRAADDAAILERYEWIDPTSAEDTVAVFANEFGEAALVIKTSGQVAAPEYSAPVINGLQFYGEQQSDCLVFANEFGEVGARINGDGSVESDNIVARNINGQPANGLVGSGSVAGNFAADINLVVSYGQSLSVGAAGVPAVSTAQRFDNLSFAGGVRTQHATDPYSGFEPLIERDHVDGVLGETPITGATDMIKELILAENRISYTQQSYQMLGTAPGIGGIAITGLVSGQPAFTRMSDNIQQGYTLAQSAGKSYQVGAIFWIQGETVTDAAAYKTALQQIQVDASAVANAAFGQSSIRVISYQTAYHPDTPDDPVIPQVQYEVARDNAAFYMACPIYWTGPDLHKTATVYKIIGAYMGLAYKRIEVDGIDWKPVSPRTIKRQGNVITARFWVPRGQLAFDTSTLSLRTNYGFSVLSSGGTPITISSVSITGPDTVRIVTASSAAGGVLRYGSTDGGNLRDTQGESIVFDGGGINHPMHNWCVVFSETLGA